MVKENRNWSNDLCLENLNFRIGIVNENLLDLFGNLVDETEELSSDVYQCEEKEEFYDSLDLKIMDFKFASGHINNIIPLRNSQILLLLKEKIAFYDFDLKKGHRLKDISSGVHQIVLIPSCGEVLSLMNSLQCILRITKGGLITKYISTKKHHERYSCVGYAGRQAYACVVHEAENNNNWTV